ncbi:hypothetical protein FQA39_LY17713 [Lamprigera yunnana]|nr:hypothetical protein FQA39_LY17713 [Lamprigera yunnana]
MVDVENLSDADLRVKLTEYGFPIMPITGTTRKLMQKKLKHLMENKNDGRRSLGRYSSEEDSDSDVKSTRRDKIRRATVGTTLMPRSVKNVVSEKNFEVPAPKDTIKTTRRTTTTTTTKVVNSMRDEFDTGSDSEPEVIATSLRTDTSYSPSSTQFHQSSTTYSKPQTVTSTLNYSNNFLPSPYGEKPISSARCTNYSSPSDSESALDRLNQIRSRLSLGSSGYERPTFTSTPEAETVETPFLSNFTRRLSQLSSANNQKIDYDYKNDVIKEHDTNGASGYARTLFARPPRYTRDLNQDYYMRNNIKGNNVIPLILIGVACLFFVCVAVMYYGMRNDSAGLESSGYFIPHCAVIPKSKPGFNCVLDIDIENAISLMQFIKPKLIKQAVNYACLDSSIKPFLKEKEVIDLQHLKTNYDVLEVQKQLDNMEVLTFKNDWGISLVKTDVGNDLSEKDILPNMESLQMYKRINSAGLAVLHPSLPLNCRIYNKMYAIFNSIIVLVAIFISLYISNKLYKYFKLYQKQQKDEVFNMVRQIIDVLETNSKDGEEFLVINHVRDMILPIKNRIQMAKVWNEAVRFINENESRVRTEVQVVQGEPFEVWRWLGNPNINTSNTSHSKSWQGQAFETQIGSVNSLPCSPTPCLKIRGMMDDNDRNLQSIHEAVLSKCAHQCRILHCAVDTTSKCVYLKCSDQSDAAIAYRSLHGWWYSGHLVTVKYLRLERYMQRFPDSPVGGPPFLQSLTPATDWSS